MKRSGIREGVARCPGFIRDIHFAHLRAGFAVRVCNPANAVTAARFHPGYATACI